MNPQIVIGANYGDEGKGLVTDFLSRTNAAKIVCRFNGGAQAGHTVQQRDGGRHVFHHFGSGSFNSLPTYLSHHFITNPIVFLDELNALEKIGVFPRVAMHRKCMITTPYDIILNHTAEYNRTDSSKHGSVGVGINETIERCSRDDGYGFDIDFVLTKGDAALSRRIKRIADLWVPKRLAELGVHRSSPHYHTAVDFARSPGIINLFKWQLEAMLGYSSVLGYDFLNGYGDNVIFEGAQGLAIDQNASGFPHVTRSNTGLKNAMEVIQAAELGKPDVTYVTRTYLTRHGAGFLPSEMKEGYESVVDRTNVHHSFQGTIRYAPLDARAMGGRIAKDLLPYIDQLSSSGLAVTWGDFKGEHDTPDKIADGAVLPLRFVSYGPTHEDVHPHYNL